MKPQISNEQKYVYLYELDSVRKTDNEILAGQEAIYREILQNGNIVVLTYNQLVDSRGFLSFFDPGIGTTGKEYRKNLISLFRNGQIRISQFGQMRTVAQYILNTLDPEKPFIFSALPIKNSQRRLAALLRRAITNSDLSELADYGPDGNHTDEELKDLFIECHPNSSGKTALEESQLTLQQMYETMVSLYFLVKTILEISVLHNDYIPPRDPAEYKNLHFHHIVECVTHICLPDDHLWSHAIEIIQTLQKTCAYSDNRSHWLMALSDMYYHGSPRFPGLRKEHFQYAEAILDLCYNYTCEISIHNISKRYDIDELRPDSDDKSSINENDMSSFKSDFSEKLKNYWRSGDHDKRFLTEETNGYCQFEFSKKKSKMSCVERELIKQARTAARIGADKPAIDTTTGAQQSKALFPHRYEYEIEQQRSNVKSLMLHDICHYSCNILICLLIAITMEMIVQFAQVRLDAALSSYHFFHSLMWAVVETIFFLLPTELFSLLIKKICPAFLTFFEALAMIPRLLCDICTICNVHKNDRKVAPAEGDLSKRERRSTAILIDFVMPKALKEYLRLRNLSITNPHFKKSSVCTIANTNDADVIYQLVRQEELYNEEFGLIYKSDFNTLITDPILSGSTKYIPYERIIPTNGDGVVMVTRCNGKFVLLHQFRHAIRNYQYGFPRGFAAPGESPSANAKRELMEELCAEVANEPFLLGRIAPDSGLTSRQTYVFLVDVASFIFDPEKEGIDNVIAVTGEELSHLLEKEVASGFSVDGYTIGAFELYSKFIRK